MKNSSKRINTTSSKVVFATWIALSVLIAIGMFSPIIMCFIDDTRQINNGEIMIALLVMPILMIMVAIVAMNIIDMFEAKYEESLEMYQYDYLYDGPRLLNARLKVSLIDSGKVIRTYCSDFKGHYINYDLLMEAVRNDIKSNLSRDYDVEVKLNTIY